MIIEKLDNKGNGICYYDNKITFVKNALPNENVEIKIVKENKKYNEAIVSKYNTYSSLREEVKCPFYELCGGCDLLHLKYEEELKFKIKKVEDILKKFGNIEFEIKEILNPIEFNYRNKATFQVKEKIGYYGKKTNEIIEIDNCLLVDEEINKILKIIKSFSLNNIYQLVIRVSKNTNEKMLIIKANGNIDEKFKNLDLDSIMLYKDNKYTCIKGKDYITEQLGDLKFIISPDSFFQVNTLGAYNLYSKVLEYASLKGNENVLDLYCGTGTIGLFLAHNVSNVTGVEINESACSDALKNKELNNITNASFICDDAKNISIDAYDLVIVDPPRSGLNENTINYLLNSNVDKIIYVSCDPVTLARDLKELNTKYEINDITLVNMFPKTEHVESILVLERNL